jgi:hypothetical protein
MGKYLDILARTARTAQTIPISATDRSSETARVTDNPMSHRKPWDAEGISRATWYRRHHETAETPVSEAAETEAPPETAGETETVRQTGETETETRETAVRETDETPRETARETAGETAPETMQPPSDAFMAALEEHYRCHPPERQQQAREDARKYRARWGETARQFDWTPAQEAGLIWQARGLEVKQLTSAQAVVGNKVIYRFQLCT